MRKTIVVSIALISFLAFAAERGSHQSDTMPDHPVKANGIECSPEAPCTTIPFFKVYDKMDAESKNSGTAALHLKYLREHFVDTKPWERKKEWFDPLAESGNFKIPTESDPHYDYRLEFGAGLLYALAKYVKFKTKESLIISANWVTNEIIVQIPQHLKEDKKKEMNQAVENFKNAYGFSGLCSIKGARRN